MGTQDITLVAEQTPGWPAAAVTDDAPLPRGSTVGRYLVLAEIGRGGMGIVYRAYDPQLDRSLALKRLRDRSTPADSPAHARLRREAQTLAKLSDPNVVTIYDVGEDDSGLYIAMELIEGRDLAAWLRAGPHPWSEVVAHLGAAGRGLAAAHRVGVVHRDFKPANVLLGDDGRVVVTDFGLARNDAEATAASELDSREDDPRSDPSSDRPSDPPSDFRPESRDADPQLTAFGVRVGTPAYMAPEQHTGEPATARTDQYSFCVALFEGLYGRRPFVGTKPDVLLAQKRDGLGTAPEGRGLEVPIPGRLWRLLERGLHPDPGRRFRTMDALLENLEPGPRRRRGTIAIAVVGLSAVAIAGVTRSGAREDPCAHSGEALVELWSAERREGLQAALSAIEEPYASHTAQRVPRTIDDWASRWTAIHREVCEATWTRAEQSAAALDTRMRCLDDGRLTFQATLSELEDDPSAGVHAAELTLALPAPERCKTLAPRATGPEPATEAEGSERIRDAVARLSTMRRVGRGREALTEAETLLTEVAAGLDPDSGAALHYALGVLRDNAGDFSGAQQSLQESARLARQIGDPQREAEAWIELTRVAGAHQHDAARGEQFGQMALATIDGMDAAGDEPILRAHALLELGEVSFRAGDDASTLSRWTEALELRRRHLPLGDEDVRVAQLDARLAGVDHRRGDHEAARARLVGVLGRYREVFGPGHPRLAAPQGNLGLVLSALGQHDEALVQMREALEIARRSRGPNHPQVAGGHDAVGHVLAAAGRPAEAEPELLRAVELFERSLGPDHPALVESLLELGQVRLTLNRARESIGPLERALRIATTATVSVPPVELADIRFALATALDTDAPDRATTLFAEALPTYQQALSPEDRRWTAIEAWQRAHAPPG